MTSPFEDCKSSGFTLLELLVVLAIMGLIAALVVGGRPGTSDTTDAKIGAELIASELRQARSRAVATGRPVGFVLDTATRRFGIDGLHPQALPAGLRLALLTGRSDVLADDVGRIRFFPDGSSTGGRIAVESRSRKLVVGVDWLSGRVAIAARN